MSSHVWQLGDNDQSSTPTKRKRTKYVAKACNHCKRRKTKCGGQQPCERCMRQRLKCEYSTSSVISDSINLESVNLDDANPGSQHIEKLQQQVLALQSRVESLSARRLSSSSSSRSEITPGVATGPVRGTSRPKHGLSFRGPPSVLDFGIAQQSLRERGITEFNRTGDFTQEPTPVASPSISLHHEGQLPFFPPLLEPFWAISREEAVRLCRVYENEMGIMYPVLELEWTINQVNTLYDHLGSLSFSRISTEGVPVIKDDDINIIKIVFACALTAEENGRSELGMRIFRSVRDASADSMWKPATIQTAIMLTLVSIYYFQTDEEMLAWRTVGAVQRMCMELGLHRVEAYSQPPITAIGLEKVVKLFWSVYTLDVRWSMGTGMPNHLNFMDIDLLLPRPTKEPYLNCMINYCRIAQKVWKFTSGPRTDHNVQVEEMEYLDWQAMQWYKSVPEQLRLPCPDSIATSPIDDPDRTMWRLKSLLYLRCNMMRILVHRPILLRAEHISLYPTQASTVVGIAKASIRLLNHLNQVSDIYKLQQVAFNWFLVSALAVLFLAVAHAPTQFNNSCKDEFYMALNLIESFSMKSYVSRRLWRSIKSLRQLGPQMGLEHQVQASAPQEPAPCVDIAEAQGLADSLPEATGSWLQEQEELQFDGMQMSQELVDLFEALGEPASMEEDQNSSNDEPWPGPESFWFGNGPELTSVLKDFL